MDRGHPFYFRSKQSYLRFPPPDPMLFVEYLNLDALAGGRASKHANGHHRGRNRRRDDSSSEKTRKRARGLDQKDVKARRIQGVGAETVPKPKDGLCKFKEVIHVSHC
eukprot:589742-Amorphochlora_amoeboformis.AAC.1